MKQTKSTLVQKQRLIKLPNGTWLDPITINSIVVEKAVRSGVTMVSHDDRIIVSTARLSSVVNCTSLQEAQEIADNLAEKVNSIKV